MSTPPDPLLARVALRIRRARHRLDLTRKALAARSGVSERFLAGLEGGAGNVSIARLRDVAEALGLFVEDLVRERELDEAHDDLARELARATPEEQRHLVEQLRALRRGEGEERARRIALLGLRGAGKSTLGARLAERLSLPFVELNREIEATSGVSVNEIFSLYGETGFRRLERQALEAVIARHEAVVIAAPGGVVEAPETFELLLARTHAVWLRARPEEHMARVRAQGDQRPMAGHPRAMDDLRAILERRARDYARAPHHLDTSDRSLETSLDELEALARGLIELTSR